MTGDGWVDALQIQILRFSFVFPATMNEYNLFDHIRKVGEKRKVVGV